MKQFEGQFEEAIEKIDQRDQQIIDQENLYQDKIKELQSEIKQAQERYMSKL
jgi:chaperonin cofactor prefoldin